MICNSEQTRDDDFHLPRSGLLEQCAAANGLSAVRSSVAGVRERTVRSARAAEAVAESIAKLLIGKEHHFFTGTIHGPIKSSLERPPRSS
jgi:hypothetical protein